MFYELIKGILQKPQAQVFFLQGYHINQYPLDQLQPHMAFYEGKRVPSLPHISVLLQLINSHIFRTRTASPLLAQVQVYHPSNYSSLVFQWSRSPLVLTANDMIPELYPQDFPDIKKRLKTKLKCFFRADRIIAISQTTRNDLLEFYNLPKNKITVIYPGVPLLEIAPQPLLQPRTRPFILYVGSRKQAYKNFKNLLIAYGANKNIHNHFDLVCCGGTPFTRAELRLMAKLGCVKTVFQRSADDSQLAFLYSRASALVYPSLYEGFGLPPLEAQAHLCPTITSEIDVFKEVLGDSTAFFNPNDPQTMATAIESVLYDQTLRSTLVAKGTQNVTHYNWQHMTHDVYDLYEKLLQQPSPIQK